MKVGSDRRTLLEAADRTLARVDRTLATAGADGIAARVRRTIEVAAPAVGMRYWSELLVAYDQDVEAGAPVDEVYEELFTPWWESGRNNRPYCDCENEEECDDADVELEDLGFMTYVRRGRIPWTEVSPPLGAWDAEVIKLQEAGVLPVGV